MTTRQGSDPILVVRRDRPVAAGQGVDYRFAGATLVSDSPLQFLAPWRIAGVHSPSLAHPAHDVSDSDFGESVTVRGWIAGRDRRVEVRWQDDGALVGIEAIGTFRLQYAGGWISCEDRSGSASVLDEALFGPPVVLQLACRGDWSLHASAVSMPGNDDVILLCGESGAGKSTLARWLSTATPAWPRIADDIVPVRLRSGTLVALPHFPQFKCPPGEAYPAAAPAERRVRAVVELSRGGTDVPVTWHPATGRDAALLLARHTVSARLFNRRLLACHLDFIRRAAPAATLSRLSYPSGKPALDDVTEVLCAHVS